MKYKDMTMKTGKVCALAVLALTGVTASAETDVCLESRPGWMKLHAKAVKLAEKNMEKLDGWKTQMTCMPGVGIIWQWDSCFMALFAGYTPGACNGLGNLDNLYSMQSKDGYVSMAYKYATREPAYGERVNPPLYAWCEWLYARRTGDLSRLPRAYDACARLFGWLKAHRTRKSNGLYWFEDTGSSGMDNSPRSGYYAEDQKGSDVCFIDLCCQQVLSARCLAKIAPLVGKADEVRKWELEADELAAKINRLMWSDRTGFYHDVFSETNNKLAAKTAAGFWALVAGVASPRQAAALAAHLKDEKTFGARNSIPSLSADDPNFQPDGGYWLGSVWPPVVYMVSQGLRANGFRELARELTAKHLDNMLEVMDGEDGEGTIWECYSPVLPEPARRVQGVRVRKDFVGWGGLGPLVLLVEDIIGLDIDALDKRVTWNLSELGRQGVKDVPFNGGKVTLTANVLSAGAFTVKAKGDRPFKLTVVSPNGRNVLETDVTPGEHEYKSTDEIE